MVQRLSGGQMQRVALARALVYEPALLLMDEPSAALTARCDGDAVRLRRIQRVTGATVICVTHDQEEAMAMSDRIIVMSHGKVDRRGPQWRCTTGRRRNSSPTSWASPTWLR